MNRILQFVLSAVIACHAPDVLAQTPPPAAPASFSTVTHFVIPQSGVVSTAGQGKLAIQAVDVTLDINGRIATTNYKVRLANFGTPTINGTIAVPVPTNPVLENVTFNGTRTRHGVLHEQQARDELVKLAFTSKNPRPLAFCGNALVCSKTLAVNGNENTTVSISFQQTMSQVGARVDYVLPRTEAIDYAVPWNITARIRSDSPISTVYSPSHELQTTRRSTNEFTTQLAATARVEPGSFRLSYLNQNNELSATVFAYPEPEIGGGYLLMLVGLPADVNTRSSLTRREVTLVLDRSGSMVGRKMGQVQQAAAGVLQQLGQNEYFNTIGYNDDTLMFADAPVVNSTKNNIAGKQFVRNLSPRGGTNYEAALQEALQQKPTAGALRIVLFLTDGLPTVGQTSEKALGDQVVANNPHRRRVYTFGVGPDVNTALLERIARETRATANFVLANESVSDKLAGVIRKLKIPVAADLQLTVLDESGQPAPDRVADLLPSQLPDLFSDDHVVLLGKYVGTKPLTIRLRGNLLGKDVDCRFPVSFDDAKAEYSFVPRLWASRKIALVVDTIRDLGADADQLVGRKGSDPKLVGLVDEVLKLTADYGIVTEYTAFLAKSPKSQSYRSVLKQALSNFDTRAYNTRMGVAAINQQMNLYAQRGQSQLKRRNGYIDANMKAVKITTVQQVNDRAFFLRDGTWTDGRALRQASKSTPLRVVKFGSGEHRKLIKKLVDEGREGTIAIPGDVLLWIDNQLVSVRSN